MNSKQKLYGLFTTDGGAKDSQTYRDSKPTTNWGGFSWYVLNSKEEDAGDEKTEVARMFLQSKRPQINKPLRLYKVAIRFSTKEDNVFKFYGTDELTCTVK